MFFLEPEISSCAEITASVEVDVEAKRDGCLLNVIDVEGGDDGGGVVDLD